MMEKLGKKGTQDEKDQQKVLLSNVLAIVALIKNLLIYLCIMYLMSPHV